MRPSREGSLTSTQMALSFADPAARRRDPGQHLEAWMLREDIQTQIMPWRPEDAGLQVSLRSGNEDRDMDRMVAQAISSNEGAWDLPEALCDFVRDVTADLVEYGKSVRELVSYLDASGEMVAFELVRVPGSSVVRTPIGWYQVVPAEVSRLRQQSRVVRLNPKRLFTFVLPAQNPSIGSVLRRLSHVERVGAQIPFGSLDETNEFYRFYEFAVQAKTHDEAVARVTRTVGWDGRGSISRSISEWYTMLRYVRFHERKLEIRAAILDELDRVLAAASKELGSDVRLKIDLPVNAGVIQSCYRALEEGTQSFSEVFETLSFI